MQPSGLWQTLNIFIYTIQPGFLFFLWLFLLGLAIVTDITATFGFFPLEFIQASKNLLGHFSTPIPTLFFFSPFFPPTSVNFRNLSSNATNLLFGNRFANHLLLVWACHLTPPFPNFLISLLLSFLYFQHLAYRCSIDYFDSPHHQHLRVSITPIFAKKVSTTPYPTFSW